MEAIQHHTNYVNVHPVERWASTLGGGLLAAAAIRNIASNKHRYRGIAEAVVAAGMLNRGITGRCGIYKALGLRTAGRGRAMPYELGVRAGASVTVRESREKVFQFWRQLENLPQVMRHLKSVQQTGGRHSHWVAEGPTGTVEWDAEIINEIPNELIAWHSLPGSVVESAGSVRFAEVDDGITQLRVRLQYNPPAGAVGAYVARLLGHEPEQEIQEDLNNLKSLLEQRRSLNSDDSPAGL